MSRVLVTGSAEGLGAMAARLLVADGHEVIVHGRSERRAQDALTAVPGAIAALRGDLASLTQTRALAEEAIALGPLDAVLHNAAVGYRESRRETEDGLEHVFQVNVLAPYVLTALLPGVARLVYMGSGLQASADGGLDDLQWTRRPWNAMRAYADSKLHDITLAFAVAARWPHTFANAVDPGWIATKMGGPGGDDDLLGGSQTQAWLAAGEDEATHVTGRYLHHQREVQARPEASDPAQQDELLAICAELSGVRLPGGPVQP